MEIERLTATGENVLTSLAQYRYLTVYQMQTLGVARDKGHLYATLRELGLRKPAMVLHLDFGVLAGYGRLSRIYFLTMHGASLLEEARTDLAPVSYPARVRLFRNDYFHRVNTVDVHIAVNQWAHENDATLDFFYTYYDEGIKKAGRNYARTRVAVNGRAIIPDVVFKHTADTTRLFAVEMYNGGETARVEKQILAYFTAFNEEAIEQTFSYPHGVRLLCIFEHERSLELMQRRFERHQNMAVFDEQIYLKPVTELGKHFGHNWRRLFSAEQSISLF